ncbi:MAG: hypothetical protein RSB81_06205 [Anaerovoracaceae bacterium]
MKIFAQAENQGNKKPLFVIVLYALAVLMGIVGIYMVYYSITYMAGYFASYGMEMKDGIKDMIQYVLSTSLPYFIYGVLFIGMGKILTRLSPCTCKSAAGQTEISKENIVEEIEAPKAEDLTGAEDAKEEAVESGQDETLDKKEDNPL